MNAAEWAVRAVDALPATLLAGLVVQLVFLVLTGLACAFVWLAMGTD